MVGNFLRAHNQHRWTGSSKSVYCFNQSIGAACLFFFSVLFVFIRCPGVLWHVCLMRQSYGTADAPIVFFCFCFITYCFFPSSRPVFFQRLIITWQVCLWFRSHHQLFHSRIHFLLFYFIFSYLLLSDIFFLCVYVGGVKCGKSSFPPPSYFSLLIFFHHFSS